jgi:metal-responsive CopG/Arc/MetJ family transcriptional regulator
MTMANKLMSVRLTDELLAQAQSIVKTDGYSTLQELMRVSLIDFIRNYRMQQLDKIAGSKKVKRASKKELEEYIKKKYP